MAAQRLEEGLETAVNPASQSEALLHEARTAVDGLDHRAGLLAVLRAETLYGFAEGDLQAARASALHGAYLAMASGDLYARERMALNLGSALLLDGRLDASRLALTEALQIARQIDDRISLAHLLAALAYHAVLSRRAPLAARLLGASETARTTAGITLLPHFGLELPAVEELAVGTLGAARFEAEAAAGRQLTRAAAIKLALGESAGSDTNKRAPTALTPLSTREAEIATLVADGLTNKQIAARLFVSERTVDSHVRNILTKLGSRSRAQIATLVAMSDRV